MKRQVRRLNVTGRRRLYQRDVLIEPDDARRNAVRVTLRASDWEFPAGSQVILEVFQSAWPVARRELGALESVEERTVVDLGDVEPTTPPRFRLKVVDDADNRGRILGATHRFLLRGTTDGDGSRRSILWMQPFDLGDRVWRVEYDREDTPVLYYNRDLVGLRERLTDARLVAALVLPEVIRRVLERMGRDTAAREDEGWHRKWRRWIKRELRIHEEAPPFDNEGTTADDAYARWVERVVSAFSRRHGLLKRAGRELKQGGRR